MNDLILELRKLLVDLKLSNYTSTQLYTKYDPCEDDYSLNSFILHSRSYCNKIEIRYILYKIIKASFVWDYKIEARFSVYISMKEFIIDFYEPVITYKGRTKRL